MNAGLMFAASMLLIAASFTIGFQGATYRLQQEAIQARVAEWTINPETGERTFKWKTPQP